MKKVSNLNRVILIVLLKSKEPLSTLEIRDAVEKYIFKNVLLASIYSALARLEEKGLVFYTSVPGGMERGGRHKLYYQLTEKGMKGC